ncbi:putative prolyl 4-hydroxylase 10 [Drosera capensis]
MAKGRISHRYPLRKSSPISLIMSILLALFFVALVLLALGFVSLPSSSSGSGESHHSANDLASIAHNSIERIDGGENDGGIEQWVEVISWEPRAFVYHNFLTKEECEYLIELAKPHMHKSTVVDSETGKSKDSRHALLSPFVSLKLGPNKFWHFPCKGTRQNDQEHREENRRFCLYTQHGEGLQILHYEVGQKYEPHYDYFLDEFNTKNGGQRIATVLMYLSDVEEGGETVFPAAKGNFSAVPYWNELSECAKGGLSVKPKMGDALLFWSMNADASLDPSSLHGGCPVIRGNKWSSTKWIRIEGLSVIQRPFDEGQVTARKQGNRCTFPLDDIGALTGSPTLTDLNRDHYNHCWTVQQCKLPHYAESCT